MTSALRRWLYDVATPVLAFASLFAGFYALLFASSRADWPLIATAAIATMAGAAGAFIVRKGRPNAALALVIAPGLLLAGALAFR
ncbi:MAG: hypothetical protein A4S17_01790 [Proteobacteria bacterium HN_bin10]|nr:MAG: hypothetical protein A4S17_01790 [Proteobacteria bacterium HN_bin10]